MVKYTGCIYGTRKELIKAYFKSQGQGGLPQLLLLALDRHKIKLATIPVTSGYRAPKTCLWFRSDWQWKVAGVRSVSVFFRGGLMFQWMIPHTYTYSSIDWLVRCLRVSIVINTMAKSGLERRWSISADISQVTPTTERNRGRNYSRSVKECCLMACSPGLASSKCFLGTNRSELGFLTSVNNKYQSYGGICSIEGSLPRWVQLLSS